MSAMGPGCVKTLMGRQFGEMIYPLRPFQNNFQHVSHLNGWNAERTSKRLDRVDVFTQPGSEADTTAWAKDVSLSSRIFDKMRNFCSIDSAKKRDQ
jgi:hypothetical protein